jgi:hypothetical protein
MDATAAIAPGVNARAAKLSIALCLATVSASLTSRTFHICQTSLRCRRNTA